MTRKPNIVLCACDQLRAFEVGCYGNEVIRTPNVDLLASEGVRFATTVTNYPVCMAARSVLLSGQHNRTCTGGVGNASFAGRGGRPDMPEYPYAGRPHLKQSTLAEELRNHGYSTAVIGKWHIHSWPHDVGFEEYLIPRVHHCHTGQCFTENGGPEFAPQGYSVDFEADRVEDFIEARQGADEPFFLYYNISVPHCPVADAPEAFRAMYAPEEMPLRPNVDLGTPLKDEERWFKVYRYDFRYYNLHLPYTEELPEGYTLRHLIAEYYGMTTWMDTVFGRMLAALDRCGLAEDTIVVFTSDHGDNLGSHGLVQKGGPNEESIRVPLILRWPALRTTPVVNRSHVAALVDVAPTLLSLVGAGIPDHMQGRDLAPLCRAESSDEEPCAFVETGRGAAIRSPRHMYFVPFADDDHTLGDEPRQFFDLREDPYQQNNLAEQDSLPAPARELDEKLRNWDAEVPWMESGC